MTISVYGVGPDIGAKEWSTLLGDAGSAGGGQSVPLGMSVSAGTISVNIAAGRTYQGGTNLVSDASVNIPVPANSGSSFSRVDVVVAQVDWAGDVNSAGSLVILQGTRAASPVAPTLTQTDGVLWQTPLARYTVTAGSSHPTGLTDLRPLPSAVRRVTDNPSITTSSSGTFTVVHNLGVLPDWAEAQVLGGAFNATPVWASRSTSTVQFVVHRMADNTVANTLALNVVWKVEA